MFAVCFTAAISGLDDQDAGVLRPTQLGFGVLGARWTVLEPLERLAKQMETFKIRRHVASSWFFTKSRCFQLMQMFGHIAQLLSTEIWICVALPLISRES